MHLPGSLRGASGGLLSRAPAACRPGRALAHCLIDGIGDRRWISARDVRDDLSLTVDEDRAWDAAYAEHRIAETGIVPVERIRRLVLLLKLNQLGFGFIRNRQNLKTLSVVTLVHLLD